MSARTRRNNSVYSKCCRVLSRYNTKIYLREYNQDIAIVDIGKEFYDRSELSMLRGCIIDLKQEKILFMSEKRVEKVFDEGAIPKEWKYSLTRGYDASVIRVFQHEGKVYYASSRTLNAETKISHQNSDRTLIEIYKSLGGLTGEDIFKRNKSYEDYCHLFLVVSRETQIYSQKEPEEKLVYAGSIKKYATTGIVEILDLPFKPEEVSEEEKKEVMSDDILNDAGFLVCTRMDNGNNERMFLYSKAYYWRKKVLGYKNPNDLFYVYCVLSNFFYVSDEEYLKHFPLVAMKDGKVVKATDKKELDKETNTMLCLYACAPRHRKSEVLTFPDKLKTAINDLMNSVTKQGNYQKFLENLDQRKASLNEVAEDLFHTANKQEFMEQIDGETFYNLWFYLTQFMKL